MRYFAAVARELHFGRAAALLGIAQPPLSQQIKALEREIGAQLLSRENKRKVELTAAGKAFLEGALKTLAQAERAASDAQRAARGESGQLAIGFVSSTMGSAPLLKAFKTMRASRPHVRLSLFELTTEEQLAALKEGRLDLALLRPPEAWREDPELKMRLLARDGLLLAVPKGHRLAGKAKVKIAELAKEPFVMAPHGLATGLYDEFLKLCLACSFAPETVQEAKTTHTVVSLVASGMGIAVVPESLRGFREDAVVYKSFSGASPTTPFAAMWRTEDSSPVLKTFLEILFKALSGAGAGLPSRPAEKAVRAKAGSPGRRG